MTPSLLYKLTDQQGTTRAPNGSHVRTIWSPGISLPKLSGTGPLCNSGWYHFYLSPFLAVILNSVHASILSPILFECKGVIGKTDHQLKVGCADPRVMRQIPLPHPTIDQYVKFGLLCAKATSHSPFFIKWVDHWIDGTDRFYVTEMEIPPIGGWVGYILDIWNKATKIKAARRWSDTELMGLEPILMAELREVVGELMMASVVETEGSIDIPSFNLILLAEEAMS